MRKSNCRKIQPSKEQFVWEQCGLQVRVVNYGSDSWIEWQDPQDIFISRVAPPIDLNNLDRYAIPELNKRDLELITETFLDDGVLWHSVSILSRKHSGGVWTASSPIFKDALFQAVYKCFGGK